MASQLKQCITSTALRSYLAEFISTFFYVFAVVGSTMSSRKLVSDASSDSASLAVVACTNAFALASAVYIAASISGGHLNPAVTFGMAVTGHIRVPTALFYWLSQILASITACVVLKVAIVGQNLPTYAITDDMTGFGASILEGILTFILVYTVFTATDPRRCSSRVIGPLMIGFVAGANVFAGGPFSGGSVNPACALGTAMVAGRFRNQAVHWVGPLIGSAFAGLIYDNVICPTQASDSEGMISQQLESNPLPNSSF